jgi:outer membrane protein OmpA-like peptidoglycan-associated protein
MQRKLLQGFSGTIALALLLTVAPACLAQQASSPQIRVDMSTLQQMKPPGAYLNDMRTKQNLVKPATAERPRKPMLIDPGIISALNPAGADVPLPATKPKPQEKTEETPRAVFFPVDVRTTSDSVNPSLEPTEPSTAPSLTVPTPMEEANAENTNVPLPSRKPAFSTVAADKTVAPEPAALAAAEWAPPLPPHRPVVQHASSTFVEKARAELRKQQNHATRETKAATPNKYSTSSMPAVPIAPVTGKLLADPLAGKLRDPDRFQLAKAMDKNQAYPAEAKKAPAKKAKPVVEEVPDITFYEETTAETLTPLPVSITEPQSGFAGENQHVLPFTSGKAELDSETAAALEKDILPRLKNDPNLRLQINGFAAPDDNDDPRRISLARALSVRTWLLGKGVEAQRMDVRALGLDSNGVPTDKVVIVLFDPNKDS